MKKQPARHAARIMLILISCARAFALDAELYALSHAPGDAKEAEMVQNRLYSQLLAFPGINAIDKRTVEYTGSTENPDRDVILIHAEIKEDGAELLFTIHAAQPSSRKSASVTDRYLSYYKILTEVKDSLQRLLSELDVDSVLEAGPAAETARRNESGAGTPSLDSISGTWTGEPSVNKIVLLRGGRGFVIFNNGASMNISVKIEGNTVTCTQTGRPNASFFPELPREVALVAALDADPIKWTMTLVADGTLTGTKASLRKAPEGSAVSAVERAVTQVTWTRQ